MDESPMAMFEQKEEETVEKILSELLDKDDIELKTEINNPLNVSRLMMISKWFEVNEYDDSSELIEKFVNYYLLYMVSHNRESRREIVTAIKGSLEEIGLSLNSKMDKLMGKD